MTLHNNYEGEHARAFNRGSDARLSGWPTTANPYRYGTKLAYLWVRGWEDVEKNWGRWCRRSFYPLPRVIPGLMSL